MKFLQNKRELLRNILVGLKKRAVHYSTGLIKKIDEHHVFLVGGGLAYSLIICIIPMVLIIFAGLGMVLERPSITGEINAFIERAIPYERYADSIKDVVSNRINEFRIYRGVAGIAGILGLLFASSGLFSSMRTILHQVYRLSPDSSVWKGKLKDFGMVLMVLVYFLLSTLVLPSLDIITNVAKNMEFLQAIHAQPFIEYIVGMISFALIFSAFFFMYFMIPQSHVPLKATAVSAFWAAFLWELAKQGFGFYITNVATYKRIYGAYAILIVIILWIYYSSIVFIIGAIIGQLYREWKEKFT